MTQQETWVWAKRSATARYTGYNTRGATVAMAREDVQGAFTPGELLGIALAGCAGLSADAAIEHRWGGAGELQVDVQRHKPAGEDRYEQLTETLSLALDTLDEAERARLVDVITRSIAKTCTVGNTLKAGALVDLEFADGQGAS